MDASEPAPRITLKDVAGNLGLSLGLVSMAMRDDPRVSLARREEIQRTAKAMGYRPNPNAAALARFRRGEKNQPVQEVIACLRSKEHPGLFESEADYGLYWKGAAQCAEKFGYRLDEFVCDGIITPSRLSNILRTRGIRGVILTSGSVPGWEACDWNSFTGIRLDESTSAPGFHVITCDHWFNAGLAVQKIRELGYRKIGFVEKPGCDGSQYLKAGFLWAHGERISAAEIPCFVPSEPSDAENAVKFARWLKKEKPEALFYDDPRVPGWLAKSGQGIGLATSNVGEERHAASGIRRNLEEIGRLAVLMLIFMLQNHRTGPPPQPHRLLVKGCWVSGGSLPRRGGQG